jgi:hypothetical protein
MNKGKRREKEGTPGLLPLLPCAAASGGSGGGSLASTARRRRERENEGERERARKGEGEREAPVGGTSLSPAGKSEGSEREERGLGF